MSPSKRNSQKGRPLPRPPIQPPKGQIKKGRVSGPAPSSRKIPQGGAGSRGD